MSKNKIDAEAWRDSLEMHAYLNICNAYQRRQGAPIISPAPSTIEVWVYNGNPFPLKRYI
jgi:hypothetical protein